MRGRLTLGLGAALSALSLIGVAGCSASGEGAAPRDRSPDAVVADFVPLVDSVVKATKSEGWHFEDEREWSPSAVGSLRGQVCSGLEGKHTLQLLLLGESVSDPKAAVAGIKGYLEDNGFGIANEFTPATGDGEFTITGQRPDGTLVDYRARSTGQSLELESECSSAITFNQNVPVPSGK